MIKEERKITITCDACGKEIPKDELAYAGENMNVSVIKITFDVWYGGERFIKEICKDCNRKIITFLNQEGMLSHTQKKDG